MGVVIRDEDGQIHAVISRQLGYSELLRLLRELEEQLELPLPRDEERDLFLIG